MNYRYYWPNSMLDDYISQQQTLTAYQNYVSSHYQTCFIEILKFSLKILTFYDLIFFMFNCLSLFESLAYNKIILRKNKIMKIKKNEYGVYCDMNNYLTEEQAFPASN